VASAKGKKKAKKKKKAKPALIKKVTLNPTKAGPVKVKIKPTKAGKKILRKKGTFKVKVKITFTPKAGGKAQTVTRKITMKGKKAKGKGKSKGRRK
jgi:hypothetical protein